MSMKYLIDVAADGTAQGKSMLASRIRDRFLDAEISVTLVRIESDRVTAPPGDDVIDIATEFFAGVDLVPGGVVGILQPAFDAVERLCRSNDPGAVVIDWAGGTGTSRLEMYAASGIDRYVARFGVRGIACVVTTSVPERMAEGARTLEATAEVVPTFSRVLVLNQRFGRFDAPPGTPQGDALATLKRAAGGASTIEMPRVHGDSWGYLAGLGMTMRTALTTDPADLAARLGCSEVLATACLAQTAAWYARMGAALDRCCFPDHASIGAAPDPDPAGGTRRGGEARPMESTRHRQGAAE